MIPQSGWTIGRIANIEIKVNVSLIFIAAFVAFVLATGFLPNSAPGASRAVYWILGVLASVIFIGAILWHELAHSIVALRYHIPVVQIVLHLFGGVAQIARNPERPGQEFWIAIAGPISSLVLAIGFGILSVLPGVIGALCRWLALVNFTLAVFNLLPGFPLDGGRVLRSVLWRIGGSFRQATRQASRVGQVMAGLFVLAALYQMLNGDPFNGIWFLLIAAFLYSAATLSYRSAKGESLPMDASIRRLMRANVPLVEPTMRLALLAWRYLDHARDQAFPVVQDGYLVGMISSLETDRIPRLEWGKFTVEEVMIPRDKLCVLSLDDDIGKALSMLESAGMDHAPVYDNNVFVGMLNRRDIVYRT